MGNKHSSGDGVSKATASAAFGMGMGLPPAPITPRTSNSAPPSPSTTTSDATAPVSPSSTEDKQQPSTPRRTASGEDIISNWKLFNDLENREEADVLELSLFLDALTTYMPGVDETTRRGKSLSDDLGSPPPSGGAPHLAKTVSEQVVGHIDIANMYMQSSELGETITLDKVEGLIESCKKGLKIPRHEIIRVVNQALGLFRTEPTLVSVTIAPANHITVVGDLHGQLDDLLLIFRENGLPSTTNPYVFNGDIVDRGDRGIEIAIIIYLFKILYPRHVFLNRGNHEEASITQVFGFMKECETKYDRFIYDLFCESFKWLPLATLLDQRVLIVHGGIPRDLVPIKEWNQLDRTEYDLTRWRDKPRFKNQREPHRLMQIMRDLLWSDPRPAKGWDENRRGAGILYGPDVVAKFMAKNKLALIIRSHECVPRGFDWPYVDKGMLVTLFSASNYCGKANNLGCFVRIPASKQAKPAFFQYMASAESRDMGVSNLDGLFSLIVEHKDELMEAFVALDTDKTGRIAVNEWGKIMEDVLDLSLDWLALQPLLTSMDHGTIPYRGFLARYNAQGGLDKTEDGKDESGDAASAAAAAATAAKEEEDAERVKRRKAFNSLYRHRARLEALFRVLDRDGNGTITLDELETGIKLLNEHLPAGMQTFSTNAIDFMRMLDFSHDNQININEFMEGFRINAKMTVHAKWKRARKKIKVLSALGALKSAMDKKEEELIVKEDEDVEAQEEPAELRQLRRVSSGRKAPILTRHGSIQRIGIAADLPDDDELVVMDTTTTTDQDIIDEEEVTIAYDDDEEEGKPVVAEASETVDVSETVDPERVTMEKEA